MKPNDIPDKHKNNDDHENHNRRFFSRLGGDLSTRQLMFK